MKLTRVQFEFTPTQMKQIDQLMSDAGLRTKKELVANALTLLAWAIREKRARRIIASIDELGRSFEVLLPALQNIDVDPPAAVPTAQGPPAAAQPT